MTTKDPLNSPADAKGKKLRTYPNEMQRWLLEAMGFSIQIMPVTEVYLAIQQGTVSGQENPIDTIYANKFYEVAPNVTLTQHVYSPIPLAISEKTWQRLSAADREAVTKAGARGRRLDPQGDPRERRASARRHDSEGREGRAGRPSSRSAIRCSPPTRRRRRSTAPTSTRSSPRPTSVRKARRRSGHRGSDAHTLAPSGAPAAPPRAADLRGARRGGRLGVVAIGAAMVALVFANVVSARLRRRRRLDHRALRAHDGLGDVPRRRGRDPPRRAHADHRVPRQARGPPRGWRRRRHRSSRRARSAGAARVVRRGHRARQPGKRAHGARLADGVCSTSRCRWARR